MKRKLSIWLMMIVAVSGSPVMAQHHFDNSISVPADLPKEVTESVNDMAYWLEKSTGKQFVVKTGEPCRNQGIQLLWEKDAGLPGATRNQLKENGQSFYLSYREGACARIIGTGKNSFINGIYTFLQELGFRWYMPGDAWTVVPAVFPKSDIDRIYVPDFLSRYYGGSGGLNAIAGTDPKNSFKADYLVWNRRNRFGTDYAVKGHAGQLFYTENKKILDANPSWFCKKAIDPFGRIDISIPEVVELFTQWALKQIKPGDQFPTVGVDPSDGAGGNDDCLPSNMPGIKSWSDKYFWLANQVAKKLDKNDERTRVQLYAYSKHAAPPSFDLEKNVYPVIIPYAFQRFTTPENFVKLWHDKLNGRSMGMYDYWNITQWSVGVPQFNIYSIPQKLRFWKQYGVTSINLETTNGKGAMGHAFWLTSQMMWNTELSFDSLYNDFLQKCFGPAAIHIKRMYDRWSLNYQEAMEVDLSLKDLSQASSAVRDPVIQTRINELKAYVHYLKLYYDFVNNRSSAASYERLVKYIHKIHHLRMVHSSALLSRYIVPPKSYTPNVQSKPSGSTAALDIEKQFQQDLKENNNSYIISDFSFDITKAKSPREAAAVNAKFITGTNQYGFYLPAKRTIKFSAGATKPTKFIIRDEKDRIQLEKIISSGKEDYTEVSVNLAAGKYTLSFGEPGRFSSIVFPKDLVFASSGVAFYDNAKFPLLYIYVPPDIDEIIYEDKSGPGTNKRGFWLDPDGKRAEPQKVKNAIYRVPVPARLRGKVWVLNIGHRSFSILNFPGKFSLTNFIYGE